MLTALDKFATAKVRSASTKRIKYSYGTSPEHDLTEHVPFFGQDFSHASDRDG